jgi:hypothetical protein
METSARASLISQKKRQRRSDGATFRVVGLRRIHRPRAGYPFTVGFPRWLAWQISVFGLP